MVAVFLVYGLAFFCLGLAVWLESLRASRLPLGRQLPWLAAFGISHALVEWSDMLLLAGASDAGRQALLVGRTILLPLSTLLLIRFGIGLIAEAGPLPRWTLFLPVLLLTPAALLVAYVVVVATADPYVAIDVWTRYLLYLSGSLLAGYGFLRQRASLPESGLAEARRLMLGAAVAFFFNALVAGLIVPRSTYGLSPWLNYESVLAATHVPVQIWRMLSAIAVTFFVIRALSVFEADRKQQMAALEAERELALETLRQSEQRFRTIFELAPIGMDIVDANGRPIQANRALQRMLGYTDDELRRMVYTDYTHPDDVIPSQQLVGEIARGQRQHGRIRKRYYTKEGQLVWGDVAVSAVRDAEDKLLYFIAMVEDITERLTMEKTLRNERESAQLARLQAATEARETAERWVNSLVDISRRIANMEQLDITMLDIVRRAQSLLKADVVSFGLLDESGQNLELRCQAAGRRTTCFEPPLAMQNAALMDILNGRRPVRYPEDVPTTHADWYCPTLAQKVSAAAVVPLQFDERPVGAIWVGRLADEPFAPTDLVGLESLTDQAVIALQHAHMASRLQSVAVLEERGRIAREMHDSLAQVLGYVGLQTQTLEALVRQGAREQALAELVQTRRNVRIAQDDVRENILSLRTTLAGEAGLVSSLEEYVAEFGVQTGTESLLINQLQAPPRLSPLTEVQLVRIVQEALANVRKHAQAGRVRVILSNQDDCFAMTVSDDGAGFVMADERHKFGLQTMRERAESVGGRLLISSIPGQGTQVDVWLPLAGE